MKRYISAAILGVAIAIAGFFLYKGLSNIAFNDRAVTVRGLAEREVKADLVTWPVTYRLVGNDLRELYDQINGNNKIIIDFLTENGISPDEIQVGSPSVYDRDAQDYSSNNNEFRYALSVQVVVNSTDVDKVNAVTLKQGELLQKGISLSTEYNSQPIYEFTSLNKIKPAMIAEATANARIAADKFAEDSQSELGGIKNAEQGQFSIDDRDQYTPFIKNVRIVTYITYYLED